MLDRGTCTRLFILSLALLILPQIAGATDWQQVQLNHTERFTDGAGVERTMVITSLRFDKDAAKMASIVVNVTIDGANRTVAYSATSPNQLQVGVYGSTPEERMTLAFHLPADGGINKKEKIMYTLLFGSEELTGYLGQSVFARSGSDPISFAALSANLTVSTAIMGSLNDEEEAEPAKASLKIFKKLFGGHIGGGVSCAKKTVERVKCNAFCTSGPDGCDCECMGIPCCSDCTRESETVREYNIGAEVG